MKNMGTAIHSTVALLILAIMCLGLVSCKSMDARLDDIAKKMSAPGTASSNNDFYQGVMDALGVGVQRAIKTLGRSGGYYNDHQVKIPLAGELQKAASALRRLGQDKYVDQFILTMNKAAERAVPRAQDIFINAIKKMKIDDAKRIIKGSDDAATQYFKDNTYSALQGAFLPVVKQATSDVSLTASYKRMTGKLGMLGQYFDPDTLDLDAYITRKALDGLFIKLAEEESKIRHDPVARTTEILKKVFG